MSSAAADTRRSVAALSVATATDHVRGQPPGQALLKTIIAAGLAGHLGLNIAKRQAVYYATPLRAAGCTATSHEFALHLGGDDVAVRFGGDAIDTDDLEGGDRVDLAVRGEFVPEGFDESVRVWEVEWQE